jgi:tyrosine aminotransferase
MPGPIMESSAKAQRTFNPIRHIVETLKPPVNHPKPMLNLALGDPTAHGLNPPDVLKNAMHKFIDSNDFNGYLPSIGLPSAREAIATYSSREGFPVDSDDVVIASGCSGAVELVISALVNDGDNILVPNPGFPLYQVIAESLGAQVKHYPLLSNKRWECDLNEMDKLIDNNTKAILINNPSNPCGANYSAKHLTDIAAIARKHNLPIIADEIYAGIVFDGVFTAANSVSGDVPVFSMGGLAKEFCVPGWRVGWIVIHDRDGRLANLKNGIKQLTQLIVGANSVVQACIPSVLTPEKGSNDEKSLIQYGKEYVNLLESNSKASIELSKNCNGLEVIEAQGAMYAMVKVQIDNLTGVKDDKDFAVQLLNEENLIVLPGSCFGCTNFVRILTCPKQEVIKDAMERMQAFCDRRSKDSSPGTKRKAEEEAEAA